MHKRDMSPYSLSLPPTAWVSGTKSSAQKKRRKTRSKRAGTFISCAMGSGEKIIEEEAKNECARPHSGIRLSVVDEVDNDSMKGDDDNERNKTDRLVLILLAGAVCVVWEFALVQTYACVGLYLISTVT